MGVDLGAESTKDLLSFAKELAHGGGEMIRKAFAMPSASDYGRKSATDPVTETDKAVEVFIFNRIRERYPDHFLIGEESASGAIWGDEPTWIVDPIDGTSNCRWKFYIVPWHEKRQNIIPTRISKFDDC